MTGVFVLSDCPVIIMALEPPSLEMTSGKRFIVPKQIINTDPS